MTSVGFGDFYPSTSFGRIIGTLLAIWGIFIFTFTATSFLISSQFSEREKRVYNKIEAQYQYFNYEKKAAEVITAVFILNLRSKHPLENDNVQTDDQLRRRSTVSSYIEKKAKKYLHKCIKSFKKLRSK
jgi:hypothetical protein